MPQPLSDGNEGTGAVNCSGRVGGTPFRAAQRDGLTCGHGQAHLPAAPQGRSHARRVPRVLAGRARPADQGEQERQPRRALRAAPAPLDDYSGDDDPGFDGVTVQWFEDMDAYRAHMAEPDFPDIWTDIGNFLDTDQLHFIVTEHPRVVMGDDAGSFPLA